uniref:B-cell receptor-associated protein 31 n=1 Tax=Myxine glutinosa TaxID=7769 RepID=UPI00358F473D
MSLQWTAVASLLYVEVFLIVLLCLPFISPPRWQRIFCSRVLTLFVSYGNFYFNILIVILMLLFADGLRETRKYSTDDQVMDMKTNPLAVDHLHMKLFRAQRNLYICGFALVLWLILRRLVTLISQLATLMASNEAFKRQAEGASAAASKYIDENNKLKEGETDDAAEEKQKLSEDLEQSLQELEKTKKALSKAQMEVLAIKKQAEGMNHEYDRLSEIHSNLQDEVQGKGNKKVE